MKESPASICLKLVFFLLVLLSSHHGRSQDNDFHIMAFDKCVKTNKKKSSRLLRSDTSYFDLEYQLSYIYTFKHNAYKFGQCDAGGISGDAAMDVVITGKRPVFAMKRHIIEESSHYYEERDSLKLLVKKLDSTFHKVEKLRFGLELDFYYIRDKKGNWNCIVPNGNYVWMYSFKRTRKSTLNRLHKEFLGIIWENCEN